MSTFRVTLVALAAAVLASACATLPGTPAAAPAARMPAAADAESFYRLGRYLQGQQRFALALAAYEQALAADPRHVATLNAVGAVHSQQGRPELAEQAFRTALQAEPSSSATFNNLGFHLLQQGRPAEALAALEQAQRLAPLDGMVLGNLAKARAAAGVQPAGTTTLAAPAQVEPAPHPSMQATVAVARIADGVYELKNAAQAAPAAPPVQLAAAAPRAADAGMVLPRVEVANGKGEAGLARRVLATLQLPAATPTRLTNHKPYGRVDSRIEYVAGAEQAARAINARLPAALPLTPVARMDRAVGVRVLLGRDFQPDVQALASAQR